MGRPGEGHGSFHGSSGSWISGVAYLPQLGKLRLATRHLPGLEIVGDAGVGWMDGCMNVTEYCKMIHHEPCTDRQAQYIQTGLTKYCTVCSY